MRKTFKYYFICWLIVLALFNVISFVTPSEIAGLNKFEGSFWTGYIFITLAFLGQLRCAYKVFKQENLKRVFYNFSLISISYSGLIAMLVAGSLCMIIPDLPNWVSIIICAIILALYAISIVKATATADIITETDKRIKEKTQFMKLLASDAEHLVATAKNNEIKEATKKVCEAVKYSDPMSNDALKSIEEQIQNEFTLFAQSVRENDAELAKSVADGLLNLIDSRNKKCKALK